LHAGLFINTDGVATLLMTLGSLALRLTYLVHCGIKGGGVLIALMIQAVDRAMRLESGLLVKNAPPCGASDCKFKNQPVSSLASSLSPLIMKSIK
jgi:hypothetical protein